jgi:hypothetical protein
MSTEGANLALSAGPKLNNGITMPWLGLGVYLTRKATK